LEGISDKETRNNRWTVCLRATFSSR
jgi:hypothetical protein